MDTDELDRIRARVAAAEEDYPIHRGCGGECEPSGPLWICHSCDHAISDTEVERVDAIAAADCRALLNELDRRNVTDRPTLPLNADEWVIRKTTSQEPPDPGPGWHLIDTHVVATHVPDNGLSITSPTSITLVCVWASKREKGTPQ